MRIHYLQHVPFEGLASIEQWATQQGNIISATQFYNGDTLPSVDDVPLRLTRIFKKSIIHHSSSWYEIVYLFFLNKMYISRIECYFNHFMAINIAR